MTKRIATISTLAVAFIGSIVAANYLTTHYGFVPVGFGFETTAGTYAAGATLALRDAVQDSAGRRWVAALIVVGAVVSLLLAAPAIALASGVAFLLSELLNMAVYTPLRKKAELGDRRWVVAVGSSNVVGALVDTVVFLGIAFGAAAIVPALAGQMVGKGWATLAYLLLGWVVSRALLRKPLLSAGGERHA